MDETTNTTHCLGDLFMSTAPQTRRKYKKPSIIEAIFEAKFSFDNESFSITTPGEIYDKIKKTYPKKLDIKHVPIYLDSTAKSSPLPLIQAPQLQAIREDNSELLQIGPGIAVANKLKYSSWENFVPAIRTVLDAYISSASPKSTNRIGTRYINRFVIPTDVIDIATYFNLGIQVPKAISNLHAFDITFINKIKSENDAPEFEVRTKFLTDSLAANENGLAFILDIDCYTMNINESRTDSIINLASKAHDILSMMFENIITDNTRTLMEVE